MCLMATMLESALLRTRKEMRGHEPKKKKKKKANLKNTPRVGCNDMQETNMHSFIKHFCMQGIEELKASALKDLII